MGSQSNLETLRFSLDRPEHFGFEPISELDAPVSPLNRFSNRHVEITRNLFPSLYSIIERTRRRLGIETQFTAFVSADESINAACFSGKGERILLWISSGITKLLSKDELSFVLGHEIGHWFLNHSQYPRMEPSDSSLFIARQSLSRAAEVSADRFGLIACGELEIALRAMVKSASGLPDSFLGPNVSEFVNQTKRITSRHVPIDEMFATHPPMPIRARALFWYTMSDDYLTRRRQTGGTDKGLIDTRIEKDLSKVLGRDYELNRKSAFERICFWTCLLEFTTDGVLGQEEQNQIKDVFGQDMLDRFKRFAHGMSKSQVIESVEKQVCDAQNAVRTYPLPHLRKYVEAKGPVSPILKKRLFARRD